MWWQFNVPFFLLVTKMGGVSDMLRCHWNAVSKWWPLILQNATQSLALTQSFKAHLHSSSLSTTEKSWCLLWLDIKPSVVRIKKFINLELCLKQNNLAGLGYVKHLRLYGKSTLSCSAQQQNQFGSALLRLASYVTREGPGLFPLLNWVRWSYQAIDLGYWKRTGHYPSPRERQRC